MVWPGEEAAWDILSGLDASDVAAKAMASHSVRDSSFSLTCFGQEISVYLKDRTFSSRSKLGATLINRLGDYSRLSILRYLIHATATPLSGQLVRPSDLPGCDIFAKGTHTLPLDKTASFFSNRADHFFEIGKSLGGGKLDYGDMSLHMLPFPCVPVALIVWSGDDEFPPDASLLLDSSCLSYLPIDIVWSTSMMTIEMMLINADACNQ